MMLLPKLNCRKF